MYINLDLNMLESDQVYENLDKSISYYIRATLSFLVSQQYVLLVKNTKIEIVLRLLNTF